MVTPMIDPLGEACALPGPSVASCYTDCDQCAYTQWAWAMLPFPPFAGLSPVVLVARGGCRWESDCWHGCDQCPDGTAAAWYAQVTDCRLGLDSAVLVPSGMCRWTSCCPGPRGVFLP